MTVLKEGILGAGVNLFFIYKFLRILTTPWENTDAFKLGIIDENGTILRKKRTLLKIEEKEAYTIMHRLVWKLKRLMEKVPFGKSRLASYAAALWLIKEEKSFHGNDKELQESFLSFLETNWKNEALILKENYEGDMNKKTYSNFKEDIDLANESFELGTQEYLDHSKSVTPGETVEIDEADTEALKRALAISKWKKAGGKVDKQPDNIEKWWGQLSPADRKRAATIAQYKKEKKAKKEEVEMKEGKSSTGYELYHKTFSSAMQHAYAFAKSKGHVVDPKEIDDKVATGPKKPSSGKTNRYSLKAGRKTVEIQVANLDNKRYELNMYIEEVELDEAKGTTAYPATIDTLRMIVKDKQNQIVMFKSGQARVDTFTASAMVQVYDALKPSTRKKFEDMIKDKVGFMRSQAFAMKMLEDTQWRDDIKKISESFEREASRTISTFSTYITEGRPAIEDPDAPRAGDKEKARRVALQKQKYKPVDVSNIARKHKIKLDGEPVPGDDQNDWLISIKGGITLDYNYAMNQTTIAGWKVDRKKIRAHITKYEQGGSSYEDLIGVGRKLGVTGFESAFELIGEQLELEEAAHANSVAGGNVNLDPHKKKKRINAKVEYEDFGGARVFVVSNDRFHASRLGKSRYARYEKYVGNDKLGETIRLYGRQNPQSPIILKNEENGTMLYLKYGASKRQW